MSDLDYTDLYLSKLWLQSVCVKNFHIVCANLLWLNWCVINEKANCGLICKYYCCQRVRYSDPDWLSRCEHDVTSLKILYSKLLLYKVFILYYTHGL